jgi:hypothetical protein
MLHLEKLGFALKWLRGQGYDNGTNMKEERKSVQNKILEKYPRLFYVLCACHPLNIYVVVNRVNDGASFSTETTFFLLYKNFTLFFWFYKAFGSSKRICFTISSKTIECH